MKDRLALPDINTNIKSRAGAELLLVQYQATDAREENPFGGSAFLLVSANSIRISLRNSFRHCLLTQFVVIFECTFLRACSTFATLIIESISNL